MFKALRDRLRGVSKQIEDEIESQLGDDVERQLQAELASEYQGDVPQEPPSEEATEADAAPGPESMPGVAPERDHVPHDRFPDTPLETAEEPRPAPPEPSSSQAAPSDGPANVPRDDAAAGQLPTTPPEPSRVEPQAPSRHVPTPESQARDAAPPATRPKQAVTGRKMFTEEEIEARLQRELDTAVSTHRAVEEAAGPGAGARFTINEDVLEEILWELEIALLESDVAVPVIGAIQESVKEQLLSLPVRGSPHDVVEKVLRNAIRRVLEVDSMDFDGWLRAKLDKKRPVVIMFVGVNGTGKTTSIGRLAHRLKEQGISSVMAAGDTFRAGAIEQLALHGERLGVRVVKHSAGADPAAVAYDAIEHAKARHKDVVLLDTAGRMQNNVSLMDEMDKIRRVADPDLVIFVGDSLAGNDAVEQARKFDEVVDIGGAILTKVDVDAKGGAALSVAYTINKPLLFVGVGQEYPDLRPFDAGWMVDRLFGSEEDALTETA